MIKLIIFDWDDVFVKGSKEGYFKCYHETLAKLGIHLGADEEKRRILENWSKPHKEELRGLLDEHPEKLNEACRIYENMLFGTDIFISSIKPLKGVVETLNNLKGKYKLAIATGIHPKLLSKIMARFEIPAVFQKIISAYDIKEEKNHKPAPYMLNVIMKYLDVAPDETIYVGDAESDVLMAQNAGVTPVVVLTGHLSKLETQKMEVKYIIEDVTKIGAILDSAKP